MKPIAIFRHAPTEGPGFLADVLEARGLPFRLIAIDAGAPVPASAEAFSGLVFMGGPMSVNDDLPWIAPALALIQRAVAAGIPVLGHCLGGQLMARALGGTVGRAPVKELGWGQVEVVDGDVARAWFGDITGFEAFHWHGETFSIPEGATRVLASAHCANQAFALGPHLAMQCHVEMTAPMVESWSIGGADEIAAAEGPAVQGGERMRADAPARIPELNRIAERLYARWLAGLRP